MPTWRYTTVDRGRIPTGGGTVEAEDYPHAYRAASDDARRQGTPFYDIAVGEKKEQD